MNPREYRWVKCLYCPWKDVYEVGRKLSYPPRCPRCGGFCGHEMSIMDDHVPVWERRQWGKDEGFAPLRRLVRNEEQGKRLWKGSW